MLIETYTCFFILNIVLTILVFLQRPPKLFLPILCAALWAGLAVAGGNITYVGMGSVNVITQSYEYGDPEHPYWFLYLFTGLGVLMLVHGFGAVMQESRKTIHERGKNVLGGY